MTSNDINFVSERRKRFTRTQKRDVVILRYTAGVVAVIFVVAVAVFAGNLWANRQLEDLEQEVANIRRQLVQNEDVERSYVILISKLKVLATILELRQDKQEALDYFTQLFGPNVLIKQINYDDQARILSLRLESPDVFVLEEVFDTLEGAEVKEQYASVNKGELRRSDIGKYEMSLAIQVGESPEEDSRR